MITMTEGGQALVLNVKGLDGGKTRTLISSPKHIIRRATKNEIEKYKEPLRQMLGNFAGIEYYFEANFKKQIDPNKPGSVTFHPIELSEKDWKYFIIEYKKGQNQPIIKLSQTFLLLDKEILLGPEVLFKSVTWPRRQYFLSKEGTSIYLDEDFYIEIADEDASLIRKTYEMLLAHNDAIFALTQRLDQLNQLYSLPLYSPFRILGYFALIESILVHKPEPTDRFDSITKQIANKFNLLNNRFDKPIQYNDFFKNNMSNITVWRKLYQIRSQIAHEGKVNFEKDFADFKDQLNLLFFLHRVIKRLLYQSLLEPELLRDIK
jgi:hypothetical protein